jgi:NADP-dependent 3-hydroxy acid dehydrogenase YdfG
MAAKNIFITGATSGIGRATALLYASRGCNATRIVVSGRREDRLASLCAEIKAMGTGTWWDAAAAAAWWSQRV